MGFSSLWVCVDKPDEFFSEEEQRLVLEQQLRVRESGEGQEAAPVLLVDVNNLIQAELGLSGHPLLCDMYTEKYWEAILRSGYDVRIVKDGDHNALRGVTKLSRMFQELDRAISAGQGFQMDDSTFSSLKATKTSSNVAYSKRLKCIYDHDLTIMRAKEEADEDLRIMCRQLIGEGRRVCILTNDASLVIGVPSSVYIFSSIRSQLHRCPQTGEYFLKGPLPTVETLIKALERKVRRLFPQIPSRSRLDGTSLCFVVSLLEGDEGRGMLSRTEDPYSILFFVSNYIFHRRVLTKRDFLFNNKARVLLASVALVISWRSSLPNQLYCLDTEIPDPCNIPSDHVSRLVDEITGVACEMTAGNNLPSKQLFGCLPRGNPDGMYKAGVETQQISSTLLTQCISKRIRKIMDIVPEHLSTPVLYNSTWGTWTSSFEPIMENTELLLSPMISLFKQMRILQDLAANSFDMLFQTIAEANTAVKGSTVIGFDSVVHFNKWFQFVKLSLEEVEQLEKVDDSTSSCLYWKSFKAAPPMTDLNVYTNHELLSFVMSYSQLPREGRFSSSCGDCSGLGWVVREKDDFGTAFCQEKYSFWAEGGHALFDVGARVDYIEHFVSSLSTCPLEKWNLSSYQNFLLGAVGLTLQSGHRKYTDVTDVINQIVGWWESELRLQEKCQNENSEFNALLLNSSLLQNLQSCACGMLTTLYILAGCFSTAGESVLRNQTVYDLIEACLLSPLYASHLVRNISCFNNSQPASAPIEEQIKFIEERCSISIEQSIQSLFPTPDEIKKSYHMAARWTELLDIIMKKCASTVAQAHVPAFSCWFDSHAVFLCLRSRSFGMNISDCPGFPVGLPVGESRVEMLKLRDCIGSRVMSYISLMCNREHMIFDSMDQLKLSEV